MKKHISKYLLVAGIAIFNYSCGVVSLDEVDNNGDQITDTQTIIITDGFPSDQASLNTALTGNSSKNWSVTGFTLAGSSSFQTCRLDDDMTLNNDGSYNYDGGGTLCGSEDNIQFKSGTWEVDFATRVLTFDQGTGNEIEALIESCEGSKVVISTRYFGMSVIAQFEI